MMMTPMTMMITMITPMVTMMPIVTKIVERETWKIVVGKTRERREIANSRPLQPGRIAAPRPT